MVPAMKMMMKVVNTSQHLSSRPWDESMSWRQFLHFTEEQAKTKDAFLGPRVQAPRSWVDPACCPIFILTLGPGTRSMGSPQQTLALCPRWFPCPGRVSTHSDSRHANSTGPFAPAPSPASQPAVRPFAAALAVAATDPVRPCSSVHRPGGQPVLSWPLGLLPSGSSQGGRWEGACPP